MQSVPTPGRFLRYRLFESVLRALHTTMIVSEVSKEARCFIIMPLMGVITIQAISLYNSALIVDPYFATTRVYKGKVKLTGYDQTPSMRGLMSFS